MRSGDEWLDALGSEVFGGWPDDPDGPITVDAGTIRDASGAGPRLDFVDFESQPGVRLRAFLLVPPESADDSTASAIVVDDEAWGLIGPWIDDPGSTPPDSVAGIPIAKADRPIALIVPRGVGPTAWEDGTVDTHIRRRFALLGQTLDGMRAWDVGRGLRALEGRDGWPGLDRETSVELAGGRRRGVAGALGRHLRAGRRSRPAHRPAPRASMRARPTSIWLG